MVQTIKILLNKIVRIIKTIQVHNLIQLLKINWEDHQKISEKRLTDKWEKLNLPSMVWFQNSSEYKKYTRYILLLRRQIWRIVSCIKNKLENLQKPTMNQSRTTKKLNLKRTFFWFNSNWLINIPIRPRIHLVSSIFH